MWDAQAKRLAMRPPCGRPPERTRVRQFTKYIFLSREMPSHSVVGGIATYYWHLLSELPLRDQVWITSTNSDDLPPAKDAVVHRISSEYVKRRLSRFQRLLQPLRFLWFRVAAGAIVLQYLRRGPVHVETPEYGADAILVGVLKRLWPRRICLHVRGHGPSGWKREE